jgi:2-dehydro-3-deoxyphosphogluconate aldolase/(4S)-4-hydroxy-2-oxoglutarate aldolase
MFEINELGLTLAHIGINCIDEAEALSGAEAFALMLGETVKNGSSSVFAGKVVELMKKPFLGQHGHIAFSTENIDRAIEVLTANGYKFNASTAKRDEQGKTKAIYFENEICGFAVHLVKR